MAKKFLQTLTTPSVLAAQQESYGRARDVGKPDDSNDAIGSEEKALIESRDSFYISTVSEDGWPYIQHRGGEAGFLRVINEHQIGFADYSGNRQLLSVGNLADNNKVALFLMDYPTQSRLKLIGRATIYGVDDAKTEVKGLAATDLEKAERVFLIDVVSFDWNCTQYITPRYTEQEMQAMSL